MKIVLISDIHGHLWDLDIPKGDVLCIAGDFVPSDDHGLNYQKLWITNELHRWFESLLESEVVKHIVFISGNHDLIYDDVFYKQKKEDEYRQTLPKNVYYLRDSEVTIDGVRFWGSPWQNWFHDWAWNLYEPELAEVYKNIPEGIDIMLSHGPAKGYCDAVEEIYHHPVTGEEIERYGDPLGSHALIECIRRAKMKYVFSGHIHSASHKLTKIHHERVKGSTYTQVANVSILNEQYRVYYAPFILEYNK
jgi:Icc-related predicted phosphoesterase